MRPAVRDRWSKAILLTKLLIFTLLVPGSVTVWLPLYGIYPCIRRTPLAWDARAMAALAVIATGAAGYLWCALDFAFAGRGTPAPIDPPKVLVARGLYRVSRNPMYLSVLTVLLGEALLFWSRQLLVYAAIVAVGFHLFVMLYEEPALRGKMGAAYEDYCERVPRWFVRLGQRHS